MKNLVIGIKNLINIFLKRKIFIKGNFSTFGKALKQSHGYSDQKIIEKKIQAFKKVIGSEKVKYERDGVLFYKHNFDKSICCFVKKISLYKKKIVVLDYGGSFASLYFKNYKKIKNFNLNWIVIEQEKIVDYFNKNYKNTLNNIFFFKKVPILSFDIVIFSSSLQYLKSPFLKLKNILKFKPKYIIFLKTPFDKKLKNKTSEIKIQYIPKNIYQSSYPIHIFNKSFLRNMLLVKNYKEIKIRSKKIIIDSITHEDIFFDKS